MAMEARHGRPSGTRQRWTEERTKKEPSLYDEWLTQEREARQSPTPLASMRRSGDTAASPSHTPTSSTSVAAVPGAATIRAVSPEPVGPATARVDGYGNADGTMEAMRATSFERAFIPRTATPTPTSITTIVGGPAATGKSPPAAMHKPRRLIKERDWERDARMMSHSPPSSRAGSGASGMLLGRNSSRSNGHGGQPMLVGSDRESALNAASAAAAARPRTRTLDQERRREASPTQYLAHTRNRIASINSVSTGSEYLASVPASTSPPSAPSLTSLRSTTSTLHSADVGGGGRRSISPTSSSTADSVTSSNTANSSARRILHLMKTLNGRMSGKIVVRREIDEPWKEIYCYIQEETASLMYEPREVESMPARTLASGLRGCGVRPSADGETPYLEVNLPQSDTEIHIKLSTQADFDAWYAALLYWQSLGLPNGQRPPSLTSSSPPRPPLPPRTSSAGPMRDRTESMKSDRRKSVISSLREAPVIKIGKMVFWDTNVSYSTAPGSGTNGRGRPASGRPSTYRIQSHGSRRWRRISGQLRENGELKLHTDADNSLISVVQLSQLSRCAIQRLDSSVLEIDFCIAIYPQYTPNPASGQPGFIRPIFLSLENRVLYEVWFVLLRAFTIPQLYGPRLPIPSDAANGHVESNRELENMLATTTTDMFRMERALNIRVVEAKMYPPTGITSPDTGFSGGKGHAAGGKTEHHGYYAEVLLDGETRGKTSVKFDGLSPFWAETFEFQDLPPVLTSASIVIKRRPPESAHTREQHESKLVHEAYGFTSDQNAGFTGLTFDVTCGKVEIYIQELEEEKEVEKWWPVVNMYDQRVGEVLIKARADEDVILMSRDYQPLGELLHRFSNGITLQIAQMVPGELKRVTDVLLNIYQVSGQASDWIMSLIEEEFDAMHKETPISRLWFSRRAGVESSGESSAGSNVATSDRELIVRDLNKNATVEANLLFRGNTLLTKTVDTHMRRLGKEYLEITLSEKIREINDKDPECEVDPNRVNSSHELERNWRRLLTTTHDVWKTIVASKHRCPTELRVIFRHIRACAEDRYGDFLRSVSYSSVSGFLFLRFFCPAVLNPQLFGLLKDDVKPRARRTFTLIAKSLQTLSNMASFGTKEQWMEPMNVFLSQNRESFKAFVDDMCYVPARPGGMTPASPGVSPTWDASISTTEEHFSYKTPKTIMQRLPPTSREGFPSLPFLIDQARAYAELVQLWLEATTSMSVDSENVATGRSQAELLAAIKASDVDLLAFHEICTSLHKRTQECLNRAERAERPHSALSFKLEELIDSLHHANPPPTNTNPLTSGDETPMQASNDNLAARNGSVSPSIAQPPVYPPRSREWDIATDDDDATDSNSEDRLTRLYDPTPPTTSDHSTTDVDSVQNSPDYITSGGSGGKIRESLRRDHRQIDSRGSVTASSAPASASASLTNVSSSSAVSSDAERSTTTALPSYDREIRHRERREAAKVQIKQSLEAARIRERLGKEKSVGRSKTPIVSSLRSKRKEKEGRGLPPTTDTGFI